jgi:putative transposase
MRAQIASLCHFLHTVSTRRMARLANHSSQGRLKLTRFRGHPNICVQGAHDGEDETTRLSDATMCRLLGVSPSGYYAWTKRQPSRRARTDTALVAEIRAAHAASRGIYGAPRIHIDLAANGIWVGRKRVARLMLAAGLAGVSRREFVTTTVKSSNRQAPDLVDRNFTAERPNLLWVADITYVPTWAGFLYLAVELDAYSRRIVGCSMATTLATRLLLDALNMALAVPRPKGVIHHSDQGSQYTSIEFGHRCREAGVRPSTGSVGDAYDNAMCESSRGKVLRRSDLAASICNSARRAGSNSLHQPYSHFELLCVQA